MYAIKPNGSYRAVTEDMELYEDETLYENIPDWVNEMAEAERIRAERVGAETAWQTREMAVIADQLLAIEDDDPSALPGTDRQWRDYRIQVRAWKEGHPDFPDETKRPISPGA